MSVVCIFIVTVKSSDMGLLNFFHKAFRLAGLQYTNSVANHRRKLHGIW